MNNDAPPSVVRFGQFEVDWSARELKHGGVRIALQGHPLQILEALLRSPGQLVTREELHQQLWPKDTFVDFEHGLNAAVKRLRDALGDSADSPRFVETLPRRGYRFIAPVEGPSMNTEPRDGGPGPVGTEAPPVAAPGPRPPLPRTRRWLVVLLTTVSLVLLATVVWRIGLAPGKTPTGPAGPTITRVTFDAGLQTQPTLSPDGRFIAYASDRSGNLDIWVQPLSGGQAVQVTNDPADDSTPAWSPDGQHIAFRSERHGGGLYLVGALGGGERRLAGFGYRPRWSPDGKRLLFSSGYGQQNFTFDKHLYLLALDETSPREVLASFFKDLWKSPSVAWHPDGERVSIWGEHRTLGPGFWTARLPDGEPVLSEGSVQPIQESYWFWWFTDFLWAPSGDALYFTAPSLGAKIEGVQNVWRVGVDPSTLRWSGPFTRLTNGPGPDAATSISADGTRIAFAGLQTQTRLWSFALDAAGRIEPGGQPLTSSGAAPAIWDISRDGTKLLAVYPRVGGAHAAPELLEQDLSTGAQRTLLRSVGPWSCLPASPRWSPDARRVGFVARRADCTTDRTIMLDVQTGEEGHLPPADGLQVFNVWDFSPDGRWLAVDVRRSLDDVTELGLLRIAGEGSPGLVRFKAVPTRTDVWDARFSPDGRWVSVNGNPTDPAPTSICCSGVSFSHVYVAPASGGQFIQVTKGAAADSKVRWSPDGTALYFLSTRGGPGHTFNVWAIRFDPGRGRPVGEPFAVTGFHSAARDIPATWELSDMKVAGHRVVVPIRETSGNVWMLENFR